MDLSVHQEWLRDLIYNAQAMMTALDFDFFGEIRMLKSKTD
jgi:hypothetical protein